MNKMVKGSLAGAAGVALLMGGFGTYATWTDTAGLEGGTVQTGRLDIEAVPAVWDDLSTEEAGDWAATDLMVPGDTVTMTQDFVINARGKNLAAELTFDPGTASGLEQLAVTPSVAVPEGITLDTTTPDRWVFSELSGPVTVTATVSYVFDGGATGDAAASASLDGATFTVAQVTN